MKETCFLNFYHDFLRYLFLREPFQSGTLSGNSFSSTALPKPFFRFRVILATTIIPTEYKTVLEVSKSNAFASPFKASPSQSAPLPSGGFIYRGTRIVLTFIK